MFGDFYSFFQINLLCIPITAPNFPHTVPSHTSHGHPPPWLIMSLKGYVHPLPLSQTRQDPQTSNWFWDRPHYSCWRTHMKTELLSSFICVWALGRTHACSLDGSSESKSPQGSWLIDFLNIT